MVRWICELPAEVQAELKKDAIEELKKYYNPCDLYGVLDDIMNERLIDVVGCEPGMLSPEKYGKYL